MENKEMNNEDNRGTVDLNGDKRSVSHHEMKSDLKDEVSQNEEDLEMRLREEALKSLSRTNKNK
jgi:hypothetical protein